MQKVEITPSELESLKLNIERAKAVIGLLWISMGSNPSPEVQEDALKLVHAECQSASSILSKLAA